MPKDEAWSTKKLPAVKPAYVMKMNADEARSERERQWNIDTYLKIAEEQLDLARKQTNLPGIDRLTLVMGNIIKAVQVLWWLERNRKMTDPTGKAGDRNVEQSGTE